jgi:WD40 repeat protein
MGCLALTLGLLAQTGTADEPRRLSQRKDRYGDALPEGVIARLGTVRWRDPDGDLVSFSADGKAILSAGVRGVKWLDANTGKELRRKTIDVLDQLEYGPDAFAFSDDRHTFAIYDGFRSQILLWDVAAGKVLRRIKVGDDRVNSLAFSPDGTILAARPSQESMARLWDVKTGKELPRLGKPLSKPIEGPIIFAAQNLVFWVPPWPSPRMATCSLRGASIPQS